MNIVEIIRGMAKLYVSFKPVAKGIKITYKLGP